MLYMVIETFRDGNPVPVYRRFRDRGRLMPPGIEYLGSWVTDFEVVPVVTSAEAAAAVAQQL